MEAPVIAVADVVEAIASYRPYRPAQGMEKALGEITQNKGILYAPAVVDACLCLFRDRGYKFV
jgi:HD-GYP domain-containing protein (c-di-GMP phosphodiesterase class II)